LTLSGPGRNATKIVFNHHGSASISQNNYSPTSLTIRRRTTFSSSTWPTTCSTWWCKKRTDMRHSLLLTTSDRWSGEAALPCPQWLAWTMNLTMICLALHACMLSHAIVLFLYKWTHRPNQVSVRSPTAEALCPRCEIYLTSYTTWSCSLYLQSQCTHTKLSDGW